MAIPMGVATEYAKAAANGTHQYFFGSRRRESRVPNPSPSKVSVGAEISKTVCDAARDAGEGVRWNCRNAKVSECVKESGAKRRTTMTTMRTTASEATAMVRPMTERRGVSEEAQTRRTSKEEILLVELSKKVESVRLREEGGARDLLEHDSKLENGNTDQLRKTVFVERVVLRVDVIIAVYLDVTLLERVGVDLRSLSTADLLVGVGDVVNRFVDVGAVHAVSSHVGSLRVRIKRAEVSLLEVGRSSSSCDEFDNEDEEDGEHRESSGVGVVLPPVK